MPQSLPRPDSPTTQRRAAIAGGQPRQVLAAAGAWLREADPEAHQEAELALAGLEPSCLLEVAAELDVTACVEALARAIDEAFEVAMEDEEEEREALAESCMEALSVRDEAESTLVAMSFVLQRMEEEGDGPAAGAREVITAVQEALQAVDAAALARARPLTSVNALRRERAERLSEEHRGAAWWFSHLATAEHDGLVEALAGREVPVGAAAAREAARASLPRREDAFGGALRALELETSPDDPGARWARAEAERSEPAATAVSLTRSLRVEDLDLDALDA